jgi:hypothetical protein
LPYRARAFAVALTLTASLVISLMPGAGPTPVAAATQKVAIIVGPVGPQTESYRDRADEIAQTAAEAGATVEKVYSPNATWDNVREAVDGANIIVYLGHGNGYPNPYSSGTEWTDRVNGWGLNIEEGEGDGDTINVDMVYCGEKALRGTLGVGDGAPQRQHCSGGPITPAPGFVMVYSNACYTPGAGEGWDEAATESVALTRVASYSRPVLALGARAYFATDLGSARIVDLILRNPGTAFGALFEQGNGYSASALRIHGHPHFDGGRQVWLQKTDGPGNRPDYFFAFAGNPAGTASGATVDYAGPVPASPFNDTVGSPFYNDIMWLVDAGITSGCGSGKFCPRSAVTREQMASFLVRGLKLPATSTDFFTDDDASAHRADINALAASKITGGCAEGRFCPSRTVTREQMASFLVRALNLPTTSVDFFADDAGSPHEADINRLAASGITGGCGTASFCPSASINREQMAAFLHRAIGK